MNYGQLKTLVGQYLESSEASFVANLPRFIINAEEEIMRQVQLQDLMQTAVSPMVIGTKYVALPGDFLSPYSLFITVAGEKKALLNKDQSFLSEFYPGMTTGEPRYYSLFDAETLMIAPPPDQSYTMEMNYYYEPPSITTGNDAFTTWISREGENALLFGTILQGYIYLKGDQDVIKMYQDKFAQAINDLKTIAEGRNRKDTYRRPDMRVPV